MKSSFISISTLLLLALSTACSDKESEWIEAPAATEEAAAPTYSYDMVLDAPKPSYDEGGASTRASGADFWQDGDVIYLNLYNNNSNVYATCTYNASTQLWKLTCSQSLVTTSGEAKCYALYGTGADPVVGTDAVRFSYLSSVYRTTAGKYTYSGGTIKVKATLDCSGWRLRFKGTAGTKIFLYNLDINVRNRLRYDAMYGSDSIWTVTMTVGPDGYTDYYVLGTIRAECDKMVITNLTTGDTYYRPFGTDIVGSDYLHKTFCYTIPTQSNLKGWRQSNVATGSVNGYEYIDLGLPSGIMWATTNIGAATVTQAGDYYQWAETTTETNYTWSTYQWCNGSGKSLTKYCTMASYGTVDNKTVIEQSDDVADAKWGHGWRVPTDPQADELALNCSWYWLTLNGQNGMMAIGKNGNCIFLPAAGHKERTNTTVYGEQGRYLTASLYENMPNQNRYLGFAEGDIYTGKYDRYRGYSVRPVIAVHEYVDLALPSGTLWATCNIGANSPEESGSYFAWGETTTKESYTSANYTYSGSSDLSGDSDAASVAWGDNWRMPTLAECEELYSYCNVTSATVNGVSGYNFTSKLNSKSFFMPKSGYYSGSTLKSGFNYWASTYRNATTAYFLEGTGYRAANRYEGLTIRPVRSAAQ